MRARWRHRHTCQQSYVSTADTVSATFGGDDPAARDTWASAPSGGPGDPPMTHSNLTSIDTLNDPRTATDQEHVDRRARREVLASEAYASVAERYDGVDGHVKVGLVDREERVVLVRPADRDGGWRPVEGPVGEDEDWIAAAKEWVEHFAGVEVDVGPVEHVRRTKYVDEADDASWVKAYEVVMHAELRPSTALDLEDAAVRGETWSVDRFESMPGDVDDADVADVRPFFG